MLGLGILGWRMRKLQIEDSERYRFLAEENRVNIRILPPKRGLVFDRFGHILANNQQNYKLVIIREEAKNTKKVLSELAKIIFLPTKKQELLNREIKKNRAFVPVTVAENLTWKEFAKVAINLPSLPGVVQEVGLSRLYLQEEVMAHLVGYVGPMSKNDLNRLPKDNPLFQIPTFQIGKTGIERELDSDLRGSAGISRLEVNASGRVMRELQRNNETAGKDIQLTVDSRLQNFSMQRMKDHSASAVVMDVTSGDIVSMCSVPSFNPNKIVNGISTKDWNNLLSNKKRPLSNKSVSDAYPPASTFKMIVAIAALQAGIMSPEEKVECNGVYELGDSKHHCWKKEGHGPTNLYEGLKRSCDIYFYEMARRVGIDAIAETAKQFGIASNIAIPVSAISKGLMPTKTWKSETFGQRWLTGDTLNAGIGQGYILTTPIQLTLMTARIATGNLIIPKLISAMNGVQALNQKFQKLDIPERVLREIRNGMAAAVNDRDGTGYKSRIIDKDYRLAGKTGTAQVRRITSLEREEGVTKNENLPWEKRDHALFTGYAPFNKPKYAVSVIVEHGGSGSRVAAPIARDILLFAFHRGIPPLKAYPIKQRKEMNFLFKSLKPYGTNGKQNTIPRGTKT